MHERIPGSHRLIRLIGGEHGLAHVAREFYACASEINPTAVGALQLTCADEAERECIDIFQESFAEHLLPSLKFGERAVFRLANLGARYERGAAAIAEVHYAVPASRKGFKLMAFKINAHVSMSRDSEGTSFGTMARYGASSVYCGALHALLDGAELPFAESLRATFAEDGRDRLADLRDPERVPPELRGLYAAIVNSRLQTRAAVREVRDRRPATPTLSVLLSAVTLNRPDADSELVTGLCLVDWRGDEPVVAERGLGDNPSAYRLTDQHGRLSVSDEEAEPAVLESRGETS